MFLRRIILSAVLGLLPFRSTGQGADAVLVSDSILDTQAYNFPNVTFGVPTVHGVTFQQDGVVTHKGWQYAAYYQSFFNGTRNVGRVSVGRRPLPGGAWQTFTFTDYDFTTIDSHNDVVLGICAEDGTIHLSFDHHVATLKYRASVAGLANHPTTTSWNASLFGPTRDRFNGSTALTQVTYPRFIPTPSGKLLFTYRSGSSGGGDEVLLEYSGTTGAWTTVGQYTTRSGSYTGTFASGTDRNAYFDMTVFDSTGRLHATWCWRETPDASSNHDLMYAYSDDVGRTWKNQLGAQIGVAGSSFIGVTTPGIIGWSIPQSRNYINNSAMATDRQGRVHVVAWHLPDAEPNQAFDQAVTSKSRYHHYWRGTDGIWRRNPTTLTGSRAKLAVDDDGRLFLMYGDATNLKIATASPAPNPEATPAASWNTWSTLNLVGGALPAGKAVNVNLVTDTSRWDQDRILSLYGQETNVSGTGPTPLHVMDCHVSRSAVLPSPADRSDTVELPVSLSWTAGIGAVQHDVYFGTSSAAVGAAALSSPEYRGRVSTPALDPGSLASATTYFWRIDSVDSTGAVSTGRVWSFTTRSLTPIVEAGAATRGYGGLATFPYTLDPVTVGGSAGVTLFIGATDGGTTASGWPQSIELGSHTLGGYASPPLQVPSGPCVFRFRATNAYGSTWSSVAALSSDRALATWAHTAVITASGYSAGETLTGFPLLVRLDSTKMPGFSYTQMLSSGGADLAFTSEDGSQLYDDEIETWDESGISFIWVRVPALAAQSKLRLWWGKSGESAPSAPARAATWSSGFGGVWHLNQSLGFDTDSSPNALSGTSTALTNASTAIIPKAASLDGTTSTVTIPNAAALNPSLISVEAWVKTTTTGIGSILSRDLPSSSRVWQFRVNAGKVEFLPFNASTNGTVLSTALVNDGQFHHVCGTWDGTTIRVYVDGLPSGSTAFAGSLRTGQTGAAFIGRMQTTAPNFFPGTLDELRLSQTARSANWIKASYDNQAPASTFLSSAAATTPDLDADHLPDGWEMASLGGLNISDGTQDTDHDGASDLLEYATGSDPATGSGIPAIAVVPPGAAAAEFVFPEIAGGSGSIGIDYTAAGLKYIVEVSDGLGAWSSGPGVVQWSTRREPLPAGLERVGVRIIDPLLLAKPKLFFRLRIQSVP